MRLLTSIAIFFIVFITARIVCAAALFGILYLGIKIGWAPDSESVRLLSDLSNAVPLGISVWKAVEYWNKKKIVKDQIEATSQPV